MGAHGHDDKNEPKADDPIDATPRHYTQTRMQPRARPQWDPAEVAKQYLDDMEEGGRLHFKKKKDAPSS